MSSVTTEVKLIKYPFQWINVFTYSKLNII
jgi:hypothetical protein